MVHCCIPVYKFHSLFPHPISRLVSYRNAIVQYINSLMSEPNRDRIPSSSPTAANGLTGYNCANCGQFVKFRRCQSNANGNRGRLMAMCKLVNEDGTQCEFFRWAPGSSRSPSATPPLHNPPAHPQVVANVVAATVTAPSGCPVQGCGQSRLANDCMRRVCRKHCMELGGCASKKHKTTVNSPANQFLPPSSDTAPNRLPPPIVDLAPAPLQPRQPDPANIPTNDPSQPLDARPNPRFASHLLPIYVESLAREQALELSKSKLDAERIASARQVVQKVTVHAWRPYVTAPESRQIQKGFTWPFFVLSSAILSLVGLQQSAESGALQMYDVVEEYWVTVDVDHVMEVQEGQRIFLRDRSVADCQGFDELFKQSTHPHLRDNLSQERTYVRNAWKTAFPVPLLSSSSSLKRKATSPVDHSLPAVKRKATSPEDESPPAVEREPATLPDNLTSANILTTGSTSTGTTGSGSTSTGSTGTVNDPIELSDGEEKRWPRDYYVCEVAPCFRDAKTSVRGGPRARTAAVTFHEHFPNLIFHSSTFSDNKALWKKAPLLMKNRYLIIGKKPAASWSKFAAEVKEYLKEQEASTSEVIEFDD